MLLIDLNCDMGEGVGNEAALMPFISSASIACGGHAGDEATARTVLRLARHRGVAVGAHPGYADRPNFGRVEMDLLEDELYTLVLEQVRWLQRLAEEEGVQLRHVKPHGALYNRAARHAPTAAVIAQAVRDADAALVLVGLSSSHSLSEANRLGLARAAEAFADRTYGDDGQLTPRTHPNALLHDPQAAVRQVRQILTEGTVTTTSGLVLSMRADTFCLHGDGPHALAIAQALNAAFLIKRN